jgi:hypothetical protein
MPTSLYCLYAYPFFWGRDACDYVGGGSEHTSHIHQNHGKSINASLIQKMYKGVRKRENFKDVKLAQTIR